MLYTCLKLQLMRIETIMELKRTRQDILESSYLDVNSRNVSPLKIWR